MWDFDYSSVKEILNLLENNELGMSKKFGQNFLVNTRVLERIADTAEIREGTSVWEIGPGIGALTSIMLKRNANVTAFEIDHGFCKILREQAFKGEKNFTLIEGDALKTWQSIKDRMPDVICANLPYNVGSVLIASFIEKRFIPERMVYTLQSEVVQRMCADNKNSQYSSFTVLCNIDYRCTEIAKVKSSNFYPAPNVDSSVVLMQKKQSLVKEEDASQFVSFAHSMFSQRRKTVKNNLKNSFSSEQISIALEKCEINENCRAEELTIQQMYQLFCTVNK